MQEGAQKPDQLQPPAATIVLAAIAARCLRCGQDLSTLPDAARYCPRCGLDTHASPPASVIAHVAEGQHGLSDLLGGWEHLFQLFGSTPRQPDLPESFPPTATSLMIKGYGNALYRLGRRYEIGDGAFANPREAFRCYAKSARLGNIWSLGRLASQLFTPERPDPPAADAPPEPDPVLH